MERCASSLGVWGKAPLVGAKRLPCLSAFGFLSLDFCLCAEGTGFGFLPKAVLLSRRANLIRANLLKTEKCSF